MKKIKLGIIGCGQITKTSHVPACLRIPGKAKITALYDLKKEAADKLKKEFSLQAETFSSLPKFMKTDIDAVIVNTPNSTHFGLSMKALEAGKHVLVEKPMACSLKEADTMIKFAKRKKLVLQVNQSIRFNKTYMKIKQLIDEGKIGEIIHLRCLRAAGTSPDIGWSPGASWFVQKKFRGGLIMDIAVHMADIMGLYAGKAKKLYAVNPIREKGREVPDNVNALIEYKNGATGILELSWTIPKGGGLFEIYGTKGTVRLGFNSNKIELAYPDKDFKIIKSRKVKISHECFVDAINGKAETPVPGEVGRHALAYSLAIEKAGQTGKAVVPELK